MDDNNGDSDGMAVDEDNGTHERQEGGGFAARYPPMDLSRRQANLSGQANQLHPQYGETTSTASMFIDRPAHGSWCFDNTSPSYVTPHQRQSRAPVYSTDDQIEQALQELTIDERQEVYHDIYGTGEKSNSVSYYEEKTHVDMVNRCLRDLDNEIDAKVGKIGASSAASASSFLPYAIGGGFVPEVLALNQAMEQNPSYVKDRNLKLGFLRVAQYDPKRALNCMVNFFEHKKSMFGVEKLTKEITIEDDFTDEDGRRWLESGVLQIVPGHDRGGRKLFFFNGQVLRSLSGSLSLESLVSVRVRVFLYLLGSRTLLSTKIRFSAQLITIHYSSPISLLAFKKKRVYFYTLMSLHSSSDIRSHRLGYISISYCIDFVDPKIIRAFGEFGFSLPLKRTALHMTFNDQKMYLAFKVLFALMPKFELSRTQLHFGKVCLLVLKPRVIYIFVSNILLFAFAGNSMEVLYEFLYYGIPIDSLPVDAQGNQRTENHHRWLENRIRIERGLVARSETISPASASAAAAAAFNPVASAAAATPERQMAVAASLQSFGQRQPPPLLSALLQVGQRGEPVPPQYVATQKRTAASSEVHAASMPDERLPSSSATGRPKAAEAFLQPLPNDVIIIDKGKTIDQNEGNRRFRDLIVEYCPKVIVEHNQASKLNKKHVINKLRRLLEEKHGVRFIKRIDNRKRGTKPLYVVADEMEDAYDVKEKISRTLRRTHQNMLEKGRK